MGSGGTRESRSESPRGGVPVERVLLAFATIFVVAGNAVLGGYPSGPNLAYDLFPISAFGTLMLVFAAGYAYDEEAGSHILRHVWDRICRLVLPMLAIHAVAGVACSVVAPLGFSAYGKAELSAWQVLVAPFTHANMHEFGFDLALWVVVPLFVAEVAYALLRKVVVHGKGRVRAALDVLLAVALLAGSVWAMDALGSGDMGDLVRETDWLRPAQSAVFLGFFALGHAYRRHAEPVTDRVPDVFAIVLLVGIQLALLLNFPDDMGMVACWMRFPAGGIISAIMALCGTLLWLRVSRLVAPGLGRGSLLGIIGRNAYSVIALHLFGFFLLNLAFSALAVSVGGDLLDGFSDKSFHEVVRYCFVPRILDEAGRADVWGLVYLVVGVSVPLALHGLWRLATHPARSAWASLRGTDEDAETETKDDDSYDGPADRRDEDETHGDGNGRKKYPYGRIAGASPSSSSRRVTSRRR